MSLKLECHSNWNVTQIGMTLKLKCHSIWNVTQIEVSFKLECHLNLNVTQKENIKLRDHEVLMPRDKGKLIPIFLL